MPNRRKKKKRRINFSQVSSFQHQISASPQWRQQDHTARDGWEARGDARTQQLFSTESLWHRFLKTRPKCCAIRAVRLCPKYSSKSMTSEGITKGINSSWIYFCRIKHQQLNKSSQRLHEAFLGLWSGSGNSTLNCNFYLAWYKHQNYGFVNLWISPKIVFEEVDIPSATFQSTCTEEAFPNSLHST